MNPATRADRCWSPPVASLATLTHGYAALALLLAAGPALALAGRASRGGRQGR